MPKEMPTVPWDQSGVFDSDTTILRCPNCGNEGKEMEAFSFLRAGFNGIKAGDPDDLDCLECNKCATKLAFADGM